MFRPVARLSAPAAQKLAMTSARVAALNPVALARFSKLSQASLQRLAAAAPARAGAPVGVAKSPFLIPQRGVFFQEMYSSYIRETSPYQTTEDQARGFTDTKRVNAARLMVYLLLAANGLVFAGQTIERQLNEKEESPFMDKHFNYSDENMSEYRFWNVITGLFRQTDMRALINLIVLWDPARLVAMEYGALTLISLYVGGCFAARIGHKVDHTFLRPRIDAKRTEERRAELPYNYNGPVSLAAGGCGAVLAASLKKYAKTRLWAQNFLYPTKALLFLGMVLGADLYDSMLRPIGGDQLSQSGYLSGGLLGMASWALLPAVTAPAWAAGEAAVVSSAVIGASPFFLTKKDE